jgi:hypothetical protein
MLGRRNALGLGRDRGFPSRNFRQQHRLGIPNAADQLRRQRLRRAQPQPIATRFDPAASAGDLVE